MNIARWFNNDAVDTAKGTVQDKMARRNLLRSGGALLGATALLGAAAPAAQAHHSVELDVACDGRTWRMLRMDPTATDQLPTRGDTFIVNGKIYPAGTIAEGLSGPDQPGSIGTWVCRGWFFVENIMEETPHVYTTQVYLLDSGDGLISEGPEGGMSVVRAITGGIGAWARARGDVTEDEVEENDTLIDLGPAEVPAPNIHFTFRFYNG